MRYDYALIQRELLIAIRGKRSQNQLNRKLKAASNQVYRWETGNTQITWDEFIQLCQLSQLPIDATLRSTFDYSDPSLSGASLVKYFVKLNNGNAPGVKPSKASLSRWTTGKRIPTLQMILKWAASLDFYLSDFSLFLLGSNATPSLQEEEGRLKKIRGIYLAHPWVGLLWRLLETHQYNRLSKHSDQFLLKHLPVQEDELKKVLQELKDAKAIENEEGRLRSTLKRFSIRGSFLDQRIIREYWLDTAVKRLQKTSALSSNEAWSFKIYSINKAHASRVREAFFRFYHEIDAILSSSPDSGKNAKPEEENQIYLLNTQIFPLYETKS